MKRLLLSGFVLFLLPLLGGCQVGGVPVTQQQINTSILQNKAAITASTSLATRLALLAVPEQDRTSATSEIHSLDVAVGSAVNQQKPDVSGFKTLIQNVLDKSKSPYVLIAGTVLDSAASVVDADLTTTYANLSTDQKAQATLTLIQAIVNGVSQGTTASFSLPHHPLPTVNPVLHSSAWSPPGDRIPSPFTRRVFC